MMRYWISAVLWMTLVLPLQAEAVFKAGASTPEAVTGEIIQITYAVENGSLSNFILPDLSPFEVVSGPARTQNFQIINGKVSRAVSISYGIRSSRTGTFTLPGATATVDGKKRQTNPITITVTGEDSPATTSVDGPPQGDIFLLVMADKSRVWEGEQVLLTYKLYYRINFENVQIYKTPSFEGFLMHDFNIGQPQERIETYRGERYYTLLFKKVALFPNRSGKMTVTPMELECTVYEDGGRGTIFRSQRQKRVIIRSNPIELDVKPLPETGRPQDFSGAVGMFSLQAFPGSTQATTGDGITLKATLRGIGNLKLAHIGTPPVPEGLDIYGPTVKEAFSSGSDALQGSKDFDFVIVPAQEGNFSIPALKFSYFDPQSGNYETISTQSISLVVKKGEHTTKEEVEQAPTGSRWKGLLGQAATLAGYMLGISAAILASLGLVFLWWWYRKKKRRKATVSQVEQPEAKVPVRTKAIDPQQIRHHLALLEIAAKAADAPSFYKIVPRLLWATQMPEDSPFDKNKLLTAIRAKHTHLENDTAILLQTAEWQLYGGGVAKATIEDDYRAVLSLVEQLRG